jgi:hypothetical protein
MAASLTDHSFGTSDARIGNKIEEAKDAAKICKSSGALASLCGGCSILSVT